MNKMNYQRELEKLLDRIRQEERVPTLFLHSCCAPCSSYVLEYLSEYFNITDFYYNPNISPQEEYEHRVQELQRLINEMPMKNPVKLVTGKYEPELFFDVVKGLEKEPEGGKRCEVCFRLRLEESARLAAAGGYDYFTTTLSISPLKNAQKLAKICLELEEKYHVRWLPSDFKKKEGYKRSIQLSGKYELYRQNYCGCVYSKKSD